MRAYFRWFMELWARARLRMIGVILLTVVSIAVKTAYPIFLKHIVDMLTGHDAPESVFSMIGWFVAFTVFHELVSHALPFSRGYLNMIFAVMMRTKYYRIITRKTTRFFKRFRTGDLLTRLTDDIDGGWDRLAWYSCSGVMRPIEAVLILAFTLGVMFTYSAQLTLYTFLPLPLLVFFLSLTEHKMVRYTDAKQKSISECNSVLEACFSGVRVIKTTRSEDDQFLRYEEALTQRVIREKDFLRINQIIQLFSMLVNHAGTVIVLFVGSYYTLRGWITLGTFLLFIIYLQRLVGPIWTISWFYASSKQVFRYVDRLIETEGYGDPDEPGMVVDHPGEFRSLDMRGVAFRFEDSESPTLQQVDITLNKGESIAVIGAVGSGKSTLLELIAGNLHPSEGEILFNGFPMSRVNAEELGRQIGYIRQENVLFSETIRRNLELGNIFGDREIDSSLELSLMKDEVVEFPQNLETVLGQRGLSLSGGQKQRLSIARTLIRKPNLLLMDDCTAAMDATTERIFWEHLNVYLPGVTKMIVTHRLATARQADRVIVLENGTIADVGTPAELAVRSQLFRKIMTSGDNEGSSGDLAQ